MDASVLVQQGTLGLAWVFLQNWLKQQKWFPWVNYDSPKWNHYFAVITSGLTTLGISYTWSAANHSLTITGLSLVTISHGLNSWLQQYLITKTGYTVLAGQLNPPAAQQPQAVVETSDIKPQSANIKMNVVTPDDPYKVT